MTEPTRPPEPPILTEAADPYWSSVTALLPMPARPEDCLFDTSQVVRHEKTGTHYEIFATPMSGIRLESTGELAYAYRELDKLASDGYPIWLRGKAEMEDGRFTLTTLKPKPLTL